MPQGKKSKAASLTKAQMVAEIAEKSGMTKSQVKEVLDAMVSVVETELKAGHPVGIQGLVKVTIKHQPARSARLGRNPATGESIMIKARPARKVIKVRALKALKDVLSK